MTETLDQPVVVRHPIHGKGLMLGVVVNDKNPEQTRLFVVWDEKKHILCGWYFHEDVELIETKQ